MSNYVNRANAEGLKEIGFDVPVSGHYHIHVNRDVPFFESPAKNFNQYQGEFSAPDLLTAADEIYSLGSGIEITFRANYTYVFNPFAEGEAENRFSEVDGDHRNAALSYAIQLIKNRHSETKTGSSER